MTNVVKHFKWEPRGKRRIHQTPRGEGAARSAVPALQSVGRQSRHPLVGTAIATYHPSAVLRADSAEHAAEVEGHL